jgi:hypothetical protein
VQLDVVIIVDLTVHDAPSLNFLTRTGATQNTGNDSSQNGPPHHD